MMGIFGVFFLNLYLLFPRHGRYFGILRRMWVVFWGIGILGQVAKSVLDFGQRGVDSEGLADRLAALGAERVGFEVQL